MLEESGIHTIHIVVGTRKVVHSTQTRIQNESNLTAVRIAYIAKKWDQNKKEDENSPQDTDKSPQ